VSNTSWELFSKPAVTDTQSLDPLSSRIAVPPADTGFLGLAKSAQIDALIRSMI